MALFFFLERDRGDGVAPELSASTSEEWAAGVAALAPAEQAAAVAAQLKKLNPDFDGSFNQRQAGDALVEFHILTDHVTDMSPVRALTGLEILVCRGSEPGKGMLTDLSPLKGMNLVYLDCSENRDLTDLSPLRGMPLQELISWSTSVSDLRPLRGMPLTHLDCNQTFVADLRPLEGMSLRRLRIRTFFAPDLTPAAGMPLQELECEFRPGRDARLLRPCNTLQKINGQPAEEFWNDVRARRNDVHAFIKYVAKLPAEQHGPAVAAKLREYNPRFDGQVSATVQDGAVVELQLFTDRVKDLRPLRALPKLRRLVCRATQRGGESLFDLAPLNQLPLMFLDCGQTNVADLSPVKKMPLESLVCRESLVRDLWPLQGKKLVYLDCSDTDVSDLTPLQGMPLERLHLRGSKVTDLSPLRGLPLREIICDFRPERDAEVLRSLKTLETINSKPARDFWAGQGAGSAARP
jgi:Leucine-rich repeat (LRR) protein